MSLVKHSNAALTKYLFEALLKQGVREFCLCPGARNAPWIMALSSPEFTQRAWIQTYSFYEERSAAFFALGRAYASQAPVVVVTTSGTAAGELLPAAMEAYYAGIPLVLLTADRPRRYRGSGAPQCAEQVGIFSAYCKTLDIEGEERPDFQMNFRNGPVHLNVCYEEPNA